MKGIIKGMLFSVILILIFICAATILIMQTEPNNTLLRIILWAIMCFGIFSGSILVSKAATEKKAAKGIITSLLSIVVITLALILLSGTAPSGMLYTLILLLAISGVIGSFVGART